MRLQIVFLQLLLPGREVEIDKVLQAEKYNSSNLGYRFDKDLTYAVLAVSSGDHESVMQSPRNALNNRPYLEDRSVYSMYSFVYFVVAKLSESELERIYATASGLILDPLSHRASTRDEKLIDDAKDLLEKSGPPYFKRNGFAETQET